MIKRLLFLLSLIISTGFVRNTSSTIDIPHYRPLISFARPEIRSSRDWPERFSFSPDGTQIAAAAATAMVNIWDVQTGAVIRTFSWGDVNDPVSVTWSPDGNLIATGGMNDEIIFVREVASGSTPYYLSGYSVAWSPDGTRLATENRSIYDAQSGKVLSTIDSPYYGCQIYWSPDGSMIATTSCHDSDYLTIWSIADGTLLDTYWGGRYAAWSPDSTRIASNGQVREIATGLPVTIIPKMSGAIAWHPNGEWIASTGDGNQISLWDANTGELLTAWVLSNCTIDSFAWSPDGNRFAANCVQPKPHYKNDLIIWERVP